LFKAVYGLISPYFNVLFISSAISAVSIISLRLIGDRDYGKRTLALTLPLAGSLALALSISPSCFAHYFTVQTFDPFHLICNDIGLAYVRYICAGWVTLITVSFSVAALHGTLSYFLSARIARTIYRASSLLYEDYPDLYDMVDDLAEKVGVYSPDLNLIESSKPQIFTYGGNGTPIIFLSVGLFETLKTEELKASIAHEIAHLKNKDTLIRSIVSSLKIASMFNIIGFLLESALLRDREFLADEEAAQLVGRRSLISALVKMSQIPTSESDVPMIGMMFFSIFNLTPRKMRLLSKHPPLDERVRRLLSLEL
jgi:Zn-dependent protease with chaperone function